MQEMTPTRRWLAEGAVIVVSILLAFAVDAAWDARAERQREILILEALAADFEAVKALLPAHLDAHQKTLESTQQLAELIVDVEPGTWVTVPGVAVVRGILNGSFDAPSGAVDALLSSGDLRLISDPELRQMLAAWPSRLRDAIEDDRMLREFWGPEFRRILAEDINILALRTDVSSLQGEERESLSTRIPVTNPLRGVVPAIRGSSKLAYEAESELIPFVDSILARIHGEVPRAGG